MELPCNVRYTKCIQCALTKTYNVVWWLHSILFSIHILLYTYIHPTQYSNHNIYHSAVERRLLYAIQN